jgi:Zn-dependent protease with chaperone function
VPAEELEQAATQYAMDADRGQSPGRTGGQQQCQLQRLRTIAAKLVPQTLVERRPRPAWKWGQPAGQEINAFCMPGGKIAFTGILDQLKLTDDEAAMIMGRGPRAA